MFVYFNLNIKKASTEIRTLVKGVRVPGANHYTTEAITLNFINFNNKLS